jgi:hypothetical protein
LPKPEQEAKPDAVVPDIGTLAFEKFKAPLKYTMSLHRSNETLNARIDKLTSDLEKKDVEFKDAIGKKTAEIQKLSEEKNAVILKASEEKHTAIRGMDRAENDLARIEG